MIEASITNFDGDFRKLLAGIEAFKDRFNQIPGMKATIVAMPLNIESSATLRAGMSKSDKPSRDARFVLKLVSTVAGT